MHLDQLLFHKLRLGLGLGNRSKTRNFLNELRNENEHLTVESNHRASNAASKVDGDPFK